MTHLPKACRIRVPGPATELRLTGRRLSGEHGAAVVAPPHPLYGGTIDNPVVLGMVSGLRRAGVGSLAFNWRGTSGSDGKVTDDLATAVADYTATMDELAAHASGPYFAAGYSFGAATALLAARDDVRVRGVVLVAPPIGMLRADDLQAVAARILVISGDDDELAPAHELRAVLAARSDATLELVASADHFFHFGGLLEVDKRISQHVSRWLDADAAS